MSYKHIEIEKKWQRYWEEHKTFKTTEDDDKKNYYALDMFPYPSGSTLYHGCIYKMFKPRYTIFCTHAVDSIHDFLP